MPQLRKDPVIGRWVIISTTRARRPGNIVDTTDREPKGGDKKCPFCHVPKDALKLEDPSSMIRVVSSDIYGQHPNKEFHRTRRGLYDVIDGLGAHEIIIETPEHLTNMADLDVDQIQAVFETYANRMRELEKNPQFRYVLAYKDYGSTAGQTKGAHTCSHVVATPVRPLRVKEKLLGAQKYFRKNKRCVYCDLIKQELSSQDRVIHETEHFVAVIPFAARFLFEMCILPKEHNCDFPNGVQGKEADLAAMMEVVLLKLQIGLDDPAYNFVVQTAPFSNRGPDADKWQTLDQDYHWHIELMPRLTRVAGFEKGTGFYICSIPPENMADYLKGVEVHDRITA